MVWYLVWFVIILAFRVMIKFIRKVLGMCEHDYEYYRDGVTEVNTVRGTFQQKWEDHKCTKCGKIKHWIWRKTKKWEY